MNIRLNNDTINQVKFPMYRSFMDREEYQYIFAESGTDHYKLLAFLSSLFQDSVICDLGTNRGLSAIALASPSNKVYSYDIVDKSSAELKQSSKNINCEFLLRNCLDSPTDRDRLLSSAIIMLDTDHDGAFEKELYSFLKHNGYKGILLLDDIHLNLAMKDFWNSIEEPKWDITSYGHFSGTGFVSFGKDVHLEQS